MTSLARLFLRDLRYHWKGFASLTAAACLICAVLTGAFLIGDSVRGTLMDHVRHNAAVARYRQRFPIPVSSPIQNGLGVLHVKGFTKDGIPVDVYALPDDAVSGRDARGTRGAQYGAPRSRGPGLPGAPGERAAFPGADQRRGAPAHGRQGLQDHRGAPAAGAAAQRKIKNRGR